MHPFSPQSDDDFQGDITMMDLESPDSGYRSPQDYNNIQQQQKATAMSHNIYPTDGKYR